MRLAWGLGVERAGKRVRDASLAAWGDVTGQGHLALPWRLRHVEGWLTKSEAAALFKSVLAAPDEGDVLEIGSWKGRSTVVIALALRKLGGRAMVHAIDPHEGIHYVAETKNQKDKGPTFAVFSGNLRAAGVDKLVDPMVMFSHQALPLLARRGVTVRLAFIDGRHDEASVREDLGLVMPLLVPRGLVAFHDCVENGHHPDVWRVWQEDLAGRAEVVLHADSLVVARPI
ncbi:class I SAM-dependent methyltransferase [bacterium]|nr:class I SAM-dependent methyltransferase [bacterium]